MSQEPQFLDLVFLAVIVLLLVMRLRSVLGTRPSSDENERKPEERKPSAIVDISEYRTLENVPEPFNDTGVDKENETPETVENLRKIKEKFPEQFNQDQQTTEEQNQQYEEEDITEIPYHEEEQQEENQEPVPTDQE